MKWIGGTALLVGCCWPPGPVQAQTYPSRPINLVVTAAAGGVTDVVARAFGQKLTEAWGQQVVVENKGGAAHVTGATAVARATPDGHTLLVAEAGTFSINPAIYPKGKLTYDEKTDFIPITGLVRINQALLASKALPVANVKELIELAKQKPGELTFGTAGVGSAPHMNIELLQYMSGAKLVPVHYRGAAPALTDLIGRPHQRDVGQRQPGAAAGSGRTRSRCSASAAKSGCRRSPTFRPSPKPACRATRQPPGSACSLPPARPATW